MHCTCQAQISDFLQKTDKRINSKGSLLFLNEDLLLTAFFSFFCLRLIDEEDMVLVKAEG